MSPTAASKPRAPLPNGFRVTRAIMVLCAALGIATGCGGSDGATVRLPQPETGMITVSITPASMTVAPGGTSGAGITVTRGGQLTAPVTLSASGVPAGVTLTFSPATVANAQQSSVTIAVAVGTQPITSEISIVGTSGTLMSSPAKLTVRIP